MDQRDRTALSAFILTSVFGGGMAVAIKFSVLELEPMWAAAFRFLGVAALFLLLVSLRKEALPRGRDLTISGAYGVLGFGLGFALGFYALTELDPGFAAVIFATVPLFTLLLAVAHGQETISRKAVAGSLVAIAGIAVMVGFTPNTSIPLLPVLAMVAAALCIAESAVLVKSLHDIHPIAVNAVGTTVGAVFLILLTLVTGTEIVMPQLTETWVAMLYMMFGSLVVFIAYLTVLEHWSASRASYSVLIMPLFTVLLSVWLLDEKIGAGFLIGAALVLSGVYIGAITHDHVRHHRHIHA